MSQLEALESLDEWFNLQQELNDRISKCMILLTRDKYHNKSLSYTLDGDVKCEVNEKDESVVIVGENSSLNMNLECGASIQNTVNFLFDVVNSKNKLVKVLNKIEK